MNSKEQFRSFATFGSILIFVLLLNTLPAFSEIIPADRQYPWMGNVGLAGGIPVRTTVCKTLSPSGGDDATAIQDALNSCPENQVVKLNSGTFNVSRTIDWAGVRNGVVLRGNGPGSTTIVFSSGNMLIRGSFSESALSTEVNLSADAVKGQKTLTLASMPSWVKVGSLYILDQLDDASFVATGGTEGGRSYRDIVGNGPRALGQIVKVVSKSSNQVTIEMPLSYSFRVAQQAQLAQAGYNPETGSPKFQCGIEDLKLTATYQASNAHMINMQTCDSCWVKNVESYNSAGGCHVITMFAYRCEIRDSSFRASHTYASGQGYGVALYHVSTGFLVENNIFESLHVGMMACYGSSTNVFGYNYVGNGIADSNQAPAISTHGAHAFMNLWEGNYVEDKVLADWTHGSSSHNTVFRNRVIGYHTGASLDQTAVSVEQYNRMWNFVGNILGKEGWHTVYSFCASGSCSQSSCIDTSKGIFKLGYRCGWACDSSTSDSFSTNAALIHGNYDTVTRQVSWNSSISDRTLRSSYYLPGKPSWFGSLAWPPYDPANPGASEPARIPAGYRFNNGTVPPPTPNSPPTPPQNLRILS